MILECFRTGTGIRFREDALRKTGMDQNTLTSLSRGQPIAERARPQRLATDVTVFSTPSPQSSAFPAEKESDWLRQDSTKDTDIERGTVGSKEDVSELPTISKEMAATKGSSAFMTEQELKDALSPIYDQLKMVNFGRPRKITKPNREGEKILVHRSVKLRMNAEKSKLGGRAYKPKAKFDPEEIEWVD
ncbi:hypothetical protein EDB83DRAFT_2439538 [Lactarius deliciosus]|nr:hypothetical protein EDB83DRAFT_2439538 [Lactarius deliciosus]